VFQNETVFIIIKKQMKYRHVIAGYAFVA